MKRLNERVRQLETEVATIRSSAGYRGNLSYSNNRHSYTRPEFTEDYTSEWHRRNQLTNFVASALRGEQTLVAPNTPPWALQRVIPVKEAVIPAEKAVISGAEAREFYRQLWKR